MSHSVTDISIRVYNHSHENELRELLQFCWRETYEPVFGKTVVDDLVNLIAHDLSGIVPGEGETAFLALLDGKVIGCTVIDEKGDIAYIWGMYIRSVFQRQGLGRRLICHAASILKNADTIQIFALVKRESAVQFYESLGFRGEEVILMDFVPGFKVEAYTKTIKVKTLLANN